MVNAKQKIEKRFLVKKKKKSVVYMYHKCRSNIWPIEKDSVLLVGRNEVVSVIDGQISSLLVIHTPRIVESTNANNLLADIDVKLISMQFILLCLFNRCLPEVLPCISSNNPLKPSMVSSNIGVSELPDDIFEDVDYSKSICIY